MEPPVKSISDVFNKFYNTGPRKGAFTLVIDRQVRPSIVAVANVKEQTDRKKVGDEVYTAMLQTLIYAIHELLPAYRDDVYLTYSIGAWQRTGAFHIKAHLTTGAFLVLIEELCKKHKCPDMKRECNLETSKTKLMEILEERFKGDHRGGKLREFAEVEERIDVGLTSQARFRVAYVNKPDYPLLSIYKKEGEKSTAAIPVQQPEFLEALDVLEEFVSKTFVSKTTSLEGKGYAIGMVLAPDSKFSATVYVAAIVCEEDFAKSDQIEQKTVEKVKESWKRENTSRGIKPFLVPGSKSESSIFSYGSYIGKQCEVRTMAQKGTGFRLTRRK